MNIVLCAVRTDIPMETACPYMGILTLAALLEEQGVHKVRVVLPLEYPDFRADLERGLAACDVLGVSCTSYNWYVSRELVQAARDVNERLKIVLGGIHASFLPEYCLRSTAADIVVRGEGEVAFPQLLDVMSRGGDLGAVNGISFKSEDGNITCTPDQPPLSVAELNRMPLPAYHLIPPGVYGYVPMEGSRGCVYNCAFCGIWFRRSHRAICRDRIDALIARLKSLEDRFVLRGVFFTDDSFGTRYAESKAILDGMSTTGYTLGMESRYHDLLRHELLPAMERNRFFLIQIGVEAGYQGGVDKVNKQLKLEQIYRFAEEVARRNFHGAVYYSMTLGLPWEREFHLLATINTGYELAVRSGSPPPMLNNFNLLPGSAMAETPGAYGLPGLGPEFWDDGNWFRPFLGFTRIPESHRQYLGGYIEHRRALHPMLPNLPLLRFPDGRLLTNRVWDCEQNVYGGKCATNTD